MTRAARSLAGACRSPHAGRGAEARARRWSGRFQDLRPRRHVDGSGLHPAEIDRQNRVLYRMMDMTSESDIGGHPGYEAYVRERILPLAPVGEPVPFRGRVHGSSDPLPFFEEMEASLRDQDGAVWIVLGPP